MKRHIIKSMRENTKNYFKKKEKGRQVDLKWVRTQLGITDIMTVEETNLGTRYRKEQSTK